MNKYPAKPLNLLLVGIGTALLFLPWGGSVPLFDWDEINFAESAREMLRTQNFRQVQINYAPFWEKPPLFIWLQAFSMWIFGVGEYAARFPNALVAIVSVSSVFYIGNRFFKGHVGEGWALAFLGSIFPHFYFNTGLIDPLFNLFIFLGIFQIYLATQQRFNRIHFVYAGVFTGLAILTKGPVALLISVLVLGIYSLLKRAPFLLGVKNWLVYLLVACAVSSLWFVPEIIVNGPWFLQEFIRYQLELASQDVASHAQPFYYHAIVLLIGCFPAAVFALNRMGKKELNESQEKEFNLFMTVLFWVVLILFSLITTKIIHYSSLAWYPISFFAALAYDEAFRNKTRMRKLSIFFFGLIALLWVVVFFVVPLLGVNTQLKNYSIPLIQDVFVQENLKTPVSWLYIDLLPPLGIALVFGVGLYYLTLKKYYKAMRTLYIGLIIMIPFYAQLIVPKAEKHIQGTLIDFYKSIEGKDCYVRPTEKSYAHLFYTKIEPLQIESGLFQFQQSYLKEKQLTGQKLNANQRDEFEQAQLEWLMNGPVDKDVYLVSKIQKSAWLAEWAGATMVHNQGGYVVYLRKKTKGENVSDSPLDNIN